MEWFLATEDLLGSALAKKLLRTSFADVEIVTDLGLEGNGKIFRDLAGRKYNQLARHNPILILTDLDSNPCAPSFKARLCAGLTLPPKLFFRIVVREAESWLMADVDNFSRQSGVSKGKIPRDLESLAAPKEKLLELIAKFGNRRFKEVLPRRDSASRVSPAYNNILVDFVEKHWNPTRAASQSTSLKRTLQRLQAFIPESD